MKSESADDSRSSIASLHLYAPWGGKDKRMHSRDGWIGGGFERSVLLLDSIRKRKKHSRSRKITLANQETPERRALKQTGCCASQATTKETPRGTTFFETSSARMKLESPAQRSETSDREADVATCIRKLGDLRGLSSSAAVEILRDTQLLLEEIDQDASRPANLDQLAAELVDQTVCAHKSAAVRLWATSCQCEVLRVYAPRAPYSSEELVRIFELVSTQLRRVANVRPLTQGQGVLSDHDEALVERVAHVIESMRQYQSCLVLVELYQQGALETTLVDFVDALLAAARDEVPALRDAILDVACLVLSECDPLPNGMLELLLVSLLPSSRRETPAAHAVAQLVVKRLHESLTRPIAAFLHGCLSLPSALEKGEDDHEEERTTKNGGNEADQDEEQALRQRAATATTTSDAAPHVYALVYELHLVEPRMLLYTLPKLADRLRADDVQTRDAAATLLARLFAAPSFDYAAAYPAVYEEWLRRFVDKEPTLRVKMVQLGVKCLSIDAAHLARKRGPSNPNCLELARQCASRLSDPDWEVRRSAVHACADAIYALQSIERRDGGADWDCVLDGLAERVADRRVEIRKEALTGLATIYHKHVSRHWEERDDIGVPLKFQPGSPAHPLSKVPGLVLRSYGAACNAGDVKERARLLLDEKLLLRPTSSAKLRAAVFLGAVAPNLVDDDDAACKPAATGFELLLREQAETQRCLEDYLDVHAEYREAAACAHRHTVEARPRSVDDSSIDDENCALDDAHSRLEAAHARLAALVPTSDGEFLFMYLQLNFELSGKTAVLRHLSAVRDKHVFRLLAVAANCAESRQSRREASEELVARLDDRRKGSAKRQKLPAVAQYARALTRHASDVLVDKDLLAAALALAAGALEQEEEVESSYEPVVHGCAGLVLVMARQHPKLLAACASEVVRYLVAAANLCEIKSFTAAARALTAIASSARDVSSVFEDTVESALVRVASADIDDDDHATFYDDCSKEAVTALAALRGRPGSDEDDRSSISENSEDSDSAFELASRLFEALDREAWTYQAPRIVARLKALNRLVLLFPGEFDRISGGVDLVDAIRNDIIDAPPLSNEGQVHLSRRSKSLSDFGEADDDAMFPVAFLTLRAAIKTVSYHVLPLGGAGDEHPAAVMDLLFTIIHTNGEPPSHATASAAERAELRLSAASIALKLVSRNSAAAKGLDVSRWRTLARVALDSDNTVRDNFCRKLCRVVERHSDRAAIFAKWGAALCLAAIPRRTSSSRAPAEAAVRARVVRALQRGVARARARHALATQDEDEDDVDERAARDRASRRFLPEYALPYAVHLLAHLNDNDRADSDTSRRALSFLLDALVGSLGDDADNVAFLLRCCAEIAAGRDNSTSPRTPACRDVANIAADSIKRTYIKTLTNFSPYPGVIFLPAKLFAASEHDPEARQRYEAVIAPAPLVGSSIVRRKPSELNSNKSPARKAVGNAKRLKKQARESDSDEDDDELSFLAKENEPPIPSPEKSGNLRPKRSKKQRAV